VPFALWKNPEGLSAALSALINAAPAADRFAVTMTGELCDCYLTKSDGVKHILASTELAAAGRDIRIYLVDGRLVTVNEARAVPLLAAASNWHALARFACRLLDGRSGALIDIGSTTTDIVPLRDGQPVPSGTNDTDRLLAGELVYTGVGRTPVCAITRWLPWRSSRCSVAAELFATAADAYVTMGKLPERLEAICTADGRPLTKECARARLARMICADASTFDKLSAERAAARIHDAQIARLRVALHRVIVEMGHQPECFVISGSGEFLARELAYGYPQSRIVSIGDRLGAQVTEAAAAHALAVLAAEVISEL
jgi:probable H4MPT-linked C1 transfer pathway protein